MEEKLSWEEKYWIVRKSYNNILLNNADLEEENRNLEETIKIVIMQLKGYRVRNLLQKSIVDSIVEILNKPIKTSKNYTNIYFEEHTFDTFIEKTINNPYIDYIKDINKQLQAYKYKEDKLRELFESEKLENLNKYYYGDSYELDAHELRKDILQILNEGVK